MGRTYSVLPTRLAREVTLWWLVEEYQRLDRQTYDETVMQISAVEVGVNRALAAVFGEKVRPLPAWDEKVTPVEDRRPEWWTEYLRVNKLEK